MNMTHDNSASRPAGPGRYGEHFSSGKAVRYKRFEELDATRLKNANDTYTGISELIPKKYRSI
jgi:hypothetical protein